MRLHVGCGNIYLRDLVDNCADWINCDIDGILASENPELALANETTIENYYRDSGTFDKLPTRRPTVVDIRADMSDLPFDFDSVDEILCIQALVHLSPAKAYETLLRWWCLLRDGGIVRISVPDMDEIESWLKDPKKIDFTIRHVYGTKRDRFNYHRSWFTFDTLKELLEFSGFRDVERLPNIHCYPAVFVRCYK
jgi:SAM-dependent methyltransferase